MNKAEQDQKKEADKLLANAASEIKRLRNKNAIQSARLEMFDDVKSLLQSEIIRGGKPMTIDVVDEIEKHLKAK